jgi:CubicO group peptidase (beta-lactamase class C family)
VREMVSRQRRGMMDQTFRQVMDWGLGVIINSAHLTPIERLPYNFGSSASADAFGHGGAQSSISFADPARELAVVILFNGMPGEPKHHARMRVVLEALWADLGES